MNNKGISKKKKHMTIDEFNKAFKMLHAVYRGGKADEDDDGVDDLRKAIEGLIASNLPGRFSIKKTVAEIQLIHGDHQKTCLVLEQRQQTSRRAASSTHSRMRRRRSQPSKYPRRLEQLRGGHQRQAISIAPQWSVAL